MEIVSLLLDRDPGLRHFDILRSLVVHIFARKLDPFPIGVTCCIRPCKLDSVDIARVGRAGSMLYVLSDSLTAPGLSANNGLRQGGGASFLAGYDNCRALS